MLSCGCDHLQPMRRASRYDALTRICLNAVPGKRLAFEQLSFKRDDLVERIQVRAAVDVMMRPREEHDAEGVIGQPPEVHHAITASKSSACHVLPGICPLFQVLLFNYGEHDPMS